MANQLYATLLAATYVSPASKLRPDSQVSDRRPLHTISTASPECMEVHPELKMIDCGFPRPLHLMEKRQVILFNPVLHLKETEAQICEITHSLKENSQWIQLINELELI